MVLRSSSFCEKFKFARLTSETRLRNHGLYDKAKFVSFSKKASFDAFQYCELTSGDKATPASPIAPERASGEIVKNGTAVEIIFGEVVCASASVEKPENIINE